jgi:hypothetical protein
MTSNTHADLERENSRNKSNGEFGTKTQTAPDVNLVTPGQARIMQMERVWQRLYAQILDEQNRLLDITEFLIVSRIDEEFGGGAAATLTLKNEAEWGEASLIPDRILNSAGETLWVYDNEDTSAFADDLSAYVRSLHAVGEDRFRTEDNPEDSDEATFAIDLTTAHRRGQERGIEL